KNMAITGPSGNIMGIGTINVGSIHDQRTYAVTSQRVTDLVQQMQLCCQAEVEARKHHDQTTASLWSREKLKAFDEMLNLQRQLPSSNQPAAVAPVVGTAPKTGEITAASPPPPGEGPEPAANRAKFGAATTAGQPKASEARVQRWLAKSHSTLRDLQKKTAAAAPTNPGQ